MVRVPFEVTKQRCQANRNMKPLQVIRQTLHSEVSVKIRVTSNGVSECNK